MARQKRLDDEIKESMSFKSVTLEEWLLIHYPRLLEKYRKQKEQYIIE